MTAWFDKLRDYFPAQEMKSQPHMLALLDEKRGQYKVIEEANYVIVYLEKEDYIFVDFMLVTGGNRSRGIGSQVIEKLKRQGKPIILEVEPVTATDIDTEKRVKFYKKLDFKLFPAIRYVRTHTVTGLLNIMDVYCWSPSPVTTEWVYQRMAESYEQVHAYRAQDFYGQPPQTAEEVLQLEVHAKSVG